MNLKIKIKRNKKVELIVLFSAIILICVFAIYQAIYTQFYKKEIEKTSSEPKEQVQGYDVVALEKDFNKIFDNKLFAEGTNLENIEKEYYDKELVYTDYYKKESTDDFEIDVTIPKINMKEAESLNNKINSTFIQKAESVQHDKRENKTIYDIKYTATVNGKILSIIVDAKLKENDDPQRELVKTYNFNLETKQELKLDEVITDKNIQKEEMQNKIKETIRKKDSDAQALGSIGYEVYKRDLRSDMYDLDKIENFYYGKDKILYIIFAYGNDSPTTERDLVIF